MQRHDGLAGAGTAADRHDALVGRADRLVLLGLDGGHDRVHRAVAGPGELGQQRALADDRQRLGAGPPRRAGRPRRRARARPCCAGSDGVRRPADRPAWPGRTPRPQGRASRSAARRSCRRAARSGRCSAGTSLTWGACRAGRRPVPRGRRRGWPSGGPPGRPSRRARPGRPRCRCGRGRDPPSPAPGRTGPPCRAGRRRCRRTPARARPRARQRHCSTPVSSVGEVVLRGTNYFTALRAARVQGRLRRTSGEVVHELPSWVRLRHSTIGTSRPYSRAAESPVFQLRRARG